MTKEVLDLNEVTQKFRILGLPFNATKEDVRRARNKLLHQFHPDKYPKGWILDETQPEKRVYLVQNAYLYIIENFEEIHVAFQFLYEQSLSSRMPINSRSHWVYTTVESFDTDYDPF
jgi:hypothetical protein